jgi:hypothetical protein
LSDISIKSGQIVSYEHRETTVLARGTSTFKLVVNSTICDRKPFVAPLEVISDEFNSLMELIVRSVVKPVLSDLKKLLDFRLKAVLMDF